MVLRGLLVALALAAPAAAASPTPWTGFNDISGVAGAVPFDTAAATAARAGATSTRVVVDWSWIEPGPGHYAWGVGDAFSGANLAHGMSPLLGVTGAPRWAWDASACCRAGTQCAFPPGRAHEDAYAAMLAQLTRRYPRAVAIEIGNEPNLAWAWAGGVSPARYTRLLKRAYTAVKSADPGMPVIAGGLAPVLSDVRTPGQVGLRPFLQGMYDHGARGYLDGISVHPYPDGTDLAKSFAAVRLVKEVRDANGDDVPLWATEFGLTTARTSPIDQAQTIAALYRALRADPEIRGLYVHTLYDAPSNPIEAERGYGLVGRDQTPKPAYCELAAAMGGSSACEGIGSLPPAAAQTARWDAQVLLQAAAD